MIYPHRPSFLKISNFIHDDHSSRWGIETISYVVEGTMVHRDSLGNEDAVTNGGIQWMSAGSGILHEEKLPPEERLFGVQLWPNMKKDEKFAPPSYVAIGKDAIPEIPFGGGQDELNRAYEKWTALLEKRAVR